ncbi:hypothetical protein FALBO_9870 [Fusarium albosuccineum]|uniref:Polyketide synthase n=1 Tax=Fusarium albosuccineum TaxID=1237068 RepID=A0A8H4PIT6_9HYPO|nr:hypothetical protein FALBO_9870 [Fusarium albosuccineum]
MSSRTPRGYSRDMLMSALQAMVIYALVQAIDPSSIAQNNVTGLIMTLGEMGLAVHHSGYLSEDEKVGSFPDVCDWIFYESGRR